VNRECLPDRRPNETQVVERDGIRITMTLGYKSNGDIGEIFLKADRADSMIDSLLSDAAIIASLGLQYGVPLRQLAHSLKRDRFNVASSLIGAVLDRIIGLEAL
jgi:hypothetical protein